MESYRGEVKALRIWTGKICQSCPTEKHGLRRYFFVGTHTAKSGGGWKGYIDVGNNVFEISFDRQGNQVGYTIRDGKLKMGPSSVQRRETTYPNVMLRFESVDA